MTVTTTVCPRVVGASDDGREMVLCGEPLPCAAHGSGDQSAVTALLANLDESLEALRAARAELVDKLVRVERSEALRPRSCPECGGIGVRGCGAAWHDGQSR